MERNFYIGKDSTIITLKYISVTSEMPISALAHLNFHYFIFLDFHRPICVKSGGDFKSRFEILEELGKGRFGVVYRVQEREESKRILAAKVIKCIKAQDRQKVMEEISIMKSLQHPKLLQLAASFESAREIVMVME